jgi:hypothetical protein
LQEELAAAEIRRQELQAIEEQLLQEELAAAEIRRQELQAAEELRIAAAETARLEAERRQRLMEEVAASLQAAAEDSRGLSAGSEDIQRYEGEFELE